MFGTPVGNAGHAGSGGGTPGTPGPPPAAGATEVAAQMVANNLKKLSKGDYSAMRISGKRAEVSSWLYVFEKTCAGVFGGVANRLIRPTRTPGAVTFTQAEWAAMEPWQREYVRLVDGELYTMVLKLIQRDTETGQTLLSNIIEKGRGDSRGRRPHQVRVL